MTTPLSRLATCLAECKRQEATTAFDLYRVFRALEDTRLPGADIPFGATWIAILGYSIDPRNTGFRNTPVTFSHGGTALDASLIPNALGKACRARQAGDLSVDEFIHEFLCIHPFIDGNGRCAFIMQNVFDRTQLAPIPLRPHTFVGGPCKACGVKSR